MPTKMLLIGVPYVIAETDAASETSAPVALPARRTTLGVQVVISDPDDVTVQMQGSITFEGPYANIGSAIELTGSEEAELALIDPEACKFIQAVITNASEVDVVVTVNASVANP